MTVLCSWCYVPKELGEPCPYGCGEEPEEAQMNRLARYKELFRCFVDPACNEADRDDAQLEADLLWPQLSAEEQALARRYAHQLAEEEMR